MYLAPKLFQLPYSTSLHPHRHDVNVGSSLTGPTGVLPTFATSFNTNNNNNSNMNNSNSQQPNGTTNFINNQGYYIPRQYVRTFPGAKRTNAPLGLNAIGGISGVSGVNKQLAASEAWSKPRLVTVIKAGEKPRKKVSILLNRKAILSFEQFVCDISDAFGLPQWKNDKIRKLYTLKGRRVQGVSDFFRDDNVFIAVSGKELLTTHMVKDLLEDLYPDSSYSQSLLKEWEKSRRLPNTNLDNSVMNKSMQRDSGLGEDDGSTDRQQIDTRRLKDLNDSKDSRDSRLISEEAINKKKKKKKKEQEVVIDIESQRQKDRLRLIEEERKKRENIAQPQNENKDQFNSSITTTNTNYTTTNKIDKPSTNKQTQQQQNETLPMIVQPSTQQNLSTQQAQQDIINKKLKRKAKLRKSQGQSDDESNYKNMNVTPSGVKPVINDDSINNGKPLQQINTNTVTLPKIGGHDDNSVPKPAKEKNREKQHDIHALRKLKRQISNAKHVTERYEILKTLGDGNFAIVKQAKLRSTDNEYAIKIIDKSKMKGKEHMIENEIYIMRSCNHPNIVKLYEEFETHDEVYLITDLVKGGDLFDAITQSVKFNERDSAGMVKDLAEALFYLHSKNIVHRDLKPENLLVLRKKDGSINIKLADFGLAMEVKVPIFTVCGTPTYVAPEILAETGYGLEVDMWACGVITYILLCGFPPFRSLDRNQEELFQFIQAGDFEYLMPYWDGISETSKDLINHLLVVDIKKRYKAEDVLSHPWIVTHGNSKESPANFNEHKRELLSELKTKAKQFAQEPFYK